MSDCPDSPMEPLPLCTWAPNSDTSLPLLPTLYNILGPISVCLIWGKGANTVILRWVITSSKDRKSVV